MDDSEPGIDTRGGLEDRSSQISILHFIVQDLQFKIHTHTQYCPSTTVVVANIRVNVDVSNVVSMNVYVLPRGLLHGHHNVIIFINTVSILPSNMRTDGHLGMWYLLD